MLTKKQCKINVKSYTIPKEIWGFYGFFLMKYPTLILQVLMNYIYFQQIFLSVEK